MDKSEDENKDVDRIKDTATTQTICPSCGKNTLQIVVINHYVAYFGEILQNTVICSNCGYRHNDFYITQQHDPIRLKLPIRKESDLNVRVVRSTSGTIRIPELGVMVEPGPASEAYITNVEGVLNRVIDAINIAISEPQDEEHRRKGEEILELIDKVKSGNFKITLIIEDPYGNSAIISEETEKVKLSEDEIKKLRTGETIIEMGDDAVA